ncbi:GNAT family N-acetyltransferase [Bacillus sp. RG28]|uniref:GNAT family N-acetyltransferase n=1 Tax=Gottfriedia endophytica TaxID=2820819 RepID=A0A940SLD2_9BACI|nr:GNAT family N-acetyltransferase [Gottfriedia endophytica]MBP0727336.1 GNAT family N-acetyltransferase [Gottfriedia endophytica]
MTIKELVSNDETIATQIIHVQKLSYQIEAKIIEFEGIPGLKETIDDVIKSEETFIGMYSEDQLVGFLSFTMNDTTIDICKLVVHPSNFKQGIASKLISHLLSNFGDSKTIIVHTGTKNSPAINLYKKFHFIESEQFLIENTLSITRLIRNK